MIRLMHVEKAALQMYVFLFADLRDIQVSRWYYFVLIIHNIIYFTFYFGQFIYNICKGNMPSFYEEAAISSVYLHANTKHWQTTYTACILPVFYWVTVHKYIYIYEFINIFSVFFNNLIKVHIPVNFYSCIAIAIYCLNYNFIFFNGSTQELKVK